MPLLPAIPTMSLGQPWTHALPAKLHQASQHGFSGIELFIDDLDCLAKTCFHDNHIAAAHHVRRLCDSLNLTIICLQPFLFYEGLLDRSQHSSLLDTKLEHWFRIAHALGTDLIQIPSNFLAADPESGAPRTTGDTEVIVSDLRRVADLGAVQNPPIRFVYEALAWGNHVYTWEASYEIVQRVDRPNLGVCLDTFHILARVYAEPLSRSGVRDNAESDLRDCLARLRAVVDPAKVFYVQVVDGERLAAPLDEKHPFYVPGRPRWMNWSRNARLFAFEEDRGGYLPVLEVVKAFVDFGFQGWVSLELFNRSLAEKDPGVPENHAKRGIESWRKLVRRLGLLTAPSTSAGAGAAVQHRL